MINSLIMYLDGKSLVKIGYRPSINADGNASVAPVIAVKIAGKELMVFEPREFEDGIADKKLDGGMRERLNVLKPFIDRYSLDLNVRSSEYIEAIEALNLKLSDGHSTLQSLATSAESNKMIIELAVNFPELFK